MSQEIPNLTLAIQGHAQDFRDRSADTLMGRKTIPLLLPQGVARWSLAALILAWTVGLIALWQPPIIASMAFFLLGMRCLGGYLWSYEEKDDYVSYCWYGVSRKISCSISQVNAKIFAPVLASCKQLVANLPSLARRFRLRKVA